MCLLCRGCRDAAVREEAAQLVLGGQAKNPSATVHQSLMNRRCTQKFRVTELHFFATGIEVVVTRQTMHRRRSAGDDRDVVGVRERRHLRATEGVRALLTKHGGKTRHEAALQRVIEISRVTAVDRDDHRRALGDPVVASIDRDRLRRHALALSFLGNGQPDDHAVAAKASCRVARSNAPMNPSSAATVSAPRAQTRNVVFAASPSPA